MTDFLWCWRWTSHQILTIAHFCSWVKWFQILCTSFFFLKSCMFVMVKYFPISRWSFPVFPPRPCHPKELKDSLDPGSDFLIELERILTNTKPISDAPCLRGLEMGSVSKIWLKPVGFDPPKFLVWSHHWLYRHYIPMSPCRIVNIIDSTHCGPRNT